MCGCLRFGYDALRVRDDPKPDASHEVPDASRADSAVADAGVDRDAAHGGEGGGGRNAVGSGGMAGATGAGAGAGGSSGPTEDDAGTESDAGPGIDVDQMLGDTGLKVADILGFYSGDWGDMVLRNVGDEIWGVYAHDGGTIVGNITEEGVFVGWWSQLPSRTADDAGEVEFRWSQVNGTVIALDGRWRWGTTAEWLENWDIDLVTDRAAPVELTNRFDMPADFRRHP
jgi:hypothetical protein